MSSEFTAAWAVRGHVSARVEPLRQDDWALLARLQAKRTHGVFASHKNDRPMPWRNRHERDLMRLLEVDGHVESYVSLPERVNFTVDGVHRHHFPSVRALTERGTIMLDVMRDDDDMAETRAQLADIIGDIYASRRIRYAALSPRQVRVEPRFSNVLHVLSFRGRRFEQGDELRLVEALSRRGGTAAIADLHAVLGEAAYAAFPMVIRRSLNVDLSALEPNALRVSLRPGGLT